LAIGATGIFTDVGLLDPRRSLIVLACSVAFVAFWVIIVRKRNRGTSDGAEQPEGRVEHGGRRTSRAGIASLVAAVAAYASWGLAWAIWIQQPGSTWTYVLGYSSAALFATAAISSLVGLSDPRPARWKLSGLVTLLLLALALLAFVIQVQLFVIRDA
jgi:hypothetical protein